MSESTGTVPFNSLKLKQLRQLLVKHFSLEELRNLSFDLGIDFDEIGGETKSAKAREFISYAERHGRLQDLLAEAAAARPALPWPISAPVDIPCPYLGLAAFRQKDAAVFFGREAFTGQLLEAVQGQTFVTVYGPSGSGKSSVVFAGLLPQLKEKDGWLTVTMRPEANPTRSLATTLLEVLEPNLSKTDWLLERGKLSGALENEELSLEEIVTLILQETENADKLLLVIDQFEELYTLVPDQLTRRRFIDSLLAAGQPANPDHPFKILLTMRADFLGQALLHPPFADAFKECSLLLGPMSTDELRQAIVEPARLAGSHFETGLVKRILDDVGSESGNLSLLEFALTELWSWQTAEQQLTHVAYEQIERVQGALATYADDVYEALTDKEQGSTQHVFVQLVKPGLGTEDARRLATRAEVGNENWPLVQKLASERLLVTDRDAEDWETVELIHEALIQHWQRLQAWMETDREFRTWQERMRTALSQWQASGEDDGALLRGVPLAEAENWLEEREDELSGRERVFIRSGLAKKRRSERIRRLAFVGALVAVVIMAVLLLLLNQSNQNVSEEATRAGEALAESDQRGTTIADTLAESDQRGTAVANALSTSAANVVALEASEAFANRESTRAIENANRADARALAAKSSEAFERDFKTSLLQAIRSVYVTVENSEPTVNEAHGALYRALVRGNDSLPLGHTGSVRSASFSPDGSQIVTASGDTTARLWDSDGTLITTLGRVWSASFSPDGSQIVTASRDRTARLWDSEGNFITTLEGHTGDVNSASFSPDGRQIVTASDDNTARLWDSEGNFITTLEGHTGAVISAGFNHDGSQIVTASRDRTARLWDSEGNVITTLEGHRDIVWSASFNHDGSQIVTASRDRTARLWDSEGSLIATLEGHTGSVLSASFSPDGDQIVTASADDTARLWDSEGNVITTLEGHTGGVWSASFNHDGSQIVTASRDNTARLWDSEGNVITTLEGHTGSVRSASFNHDGSQIVTASDDNTARLWDSEGNVITTLEGHTGSVRSASFSPDGSQIITASDDNTARLWDSEGNFITTLEGHTGGVWSAGFSPDGSQIVTASDDNTARLWDSEGSLIATLEGHTGSVLSASFSPDGDQIVTASIDRTARLWDREGNVITTLEGHRNIVRSASFNHDGSQIVTASWDATARLWDREGSLISTLKGHTDFVNSASFSPDGRQIVTASRDDTARLWDSEGNFITTLEGHRGDVNSASFSPDGRQIVTASRDDTARLWDSEGNFITTLEGHRGDVNSASFSPDGRQIVTASDDNTARLWTVELDILLTEGKRRLFPMLTLEECKQYFPEECPSGATEVPIP